MLRRYISVFGAFLLLLSLVAGCTAKKDLNISSDIRIYQVLPVARTHTSFKHTEGGGEAISLINGGTKPHTLTGWMVESSNGKVALPKVTLQPGQVIYLANDAKYFQAYWNFAPTFEYGNTTDLSVPDLLLPDQKAPQLKAAGDTIRLADEAGKTVDLLVYGNVGNPPAPWSGPPVQLVSSFPITVGNQVITRRKIGDHLQLEARSDAWSGGTQTAPERVFYAGQSDFPVKSVRGTMTLTAASAPDNAGRVLFDLVDGARKSIRMVGYQFTNMGLADRLIEAVKRGVKVTIAIERNPGGGDMFDSDKESQLKLHRGGVEVIYDYKWDGDLSSRFNPVHSKYAIFDDESLLIASGNWINSVYNLDTSCGNREWIAVIKGNPEVVKLLREVWDFDFGAGHKEVRQYNEKLDAPIQPDDYDPGPCFKYTPVKPYALTVTERATVTRILSPDNTLDRTVGFLGLMLNARQELLINANYINQWWGKADEASNITKYPDPYIQELVAAARRGVDVKVIFDYRSLKAGDLRGNQYVVKYLNDLGVKEGLNLHARLINMDGSGIGRTYHNKSFIVDGSVVISSINGSENSFRYAREAALRFEGVPEFTNYYRDLFTHDWMTSATPNMPSGVKALPRDTGTYLDWVLNRELEVVKYEVFYKPDATTAWQKRGTVTRPGFVDGNEKGIWGIVAVTSTGTKSDYAEVGR